MLPGVARPGALAALPRLDLALAALTLAAGLEALRLLLELLLLVGELAARLAALSPVQLTVAIAVIEREQLLARTVLLGVSTLCACEAGEGQEQREAEGSSSHVVFGKRAVTGR